MAHPPIQLTDLERYAQDHGITLGQLSCEVMASLLTGVPADQFGIYGRCWLLLSEHDEAAEVARLAAEFVTADICPHCGSAPRITGGRHPIEYCPVCEATVLEARRINGDYYRRWSTPANGHNLT